MSSNTFYWHDYETFGVNPMRDRPAQFAGVRTDESLNIIGEPLVIYCKPAEDRLPSPDASMITGITPQFALEQGVNEAAFIAAINEELARPGTCGAGYNSLRFDDEVTRHLLYRNFMDPYAREWQNQCSRWDIIDLVRMTYALRPEGIEWPIGEDGNPSFRLELLTAANDIAHDAAHDALSDVIATIALAKLIREKQPKLYDWLYGLRNKHRVAEQIDVSAGKPFVHTTRMYPAVTGCTSLVFPFGFETRNKSSLLVYDLRQDPEEFLEMSSEALESSLYTPRDQLSEGSHRLPIKSLKINKSPAIAPSSTLNDIAVERIAIDLPACERHRQTLMQQPDFVERVLKLFASQDFPKVSDVDFMLYDGFLGEGDRKLCHQIHRSTPEALATSVFNFTDKRLPELLFRYRARNWPESLDQDEVEVWQDHCLEQAHTGGADGKSLGLDEYFLRINTLRDEYADQPDRVATLADLEQWGNRYI